MNEVMQHEIFGRETARRTRQEIAGRPLVDLTTDCPKRAAQCMYKFHTDRNSLAAILTLTTNFGFSSYGNESTVVR
jgi:hypothetical protein